MQRRKINFMKQKRILFSKSYVFDDRVYEYKNYIFFRVLKKYKTKSNDKTKNLLEFKKFKTLKLIILSRYKLIKDNKLKIVDYNFYRL